MSKPRVGAYEIEALIGKGGMAEVYRARALSGPRAGQLAAVKRLLPALAADPVYVDMFATEADLSRMLRHPNIVEVYETGTSAGSYYIAMEYVDGRNLRQILQQCAARGIRLPVDFAAYVGQALAEALDYAHNARGPKGAPLGIVHCDVTPANVFISRLGEIKLGDFGVARAGAAAPQGSAGAFGKVQYLAPEQLRGGPVTPRTDLFALGAVLYELFTDERAFPGGDANEVGHRILAGEVRPPSQLRPELPPALEQLVLRCLAAEPERRFETAFELGVALSTLYDPAIGTPLAIAAVVRGLFGAGANATPG